MSNSKDTNYTGGLASKGRNGDTMVGHFTPGEVVIPREIANMRPDLVGAVFNQVSNMGGNPLSLIAGNGRINPSTGFEEFATQQEVVDMYQNVLGRAPESQEIIDKWANYGDFSKDTFLNAAAPEIASHVNEAYQTNFGRDAEAGGLQHWTDLANAKTWGSVNELNDIIRASALGEDIKARDDAAQYSTAWRQGLDPNAQPLFYDVDKDQWNPLAVKKPVSPLASGQGQNGPGAAYDPNTSVYQTGNVTAPVPDTSGTVYAPGVTSSLNPTLGKASGWGWNPSTNSWMGTRTGTEYGPTPYKTTDEVGKVIRSWGLAAHPWDAATVTSPVVKLPEWDAPEWQGATDASFRPDVKSYAEGGSVDAGALQSYLQAIRAQTPTYGATEREVSVGGDMGSERQSFERNPEYSASGDFYRVLADEDTQALQGGHNYDTYRYVDPTRDAVADGKWEKFITPHAEEDKYLWAGVNDPRYAESLGRQFGGTASAFDEARLMAPGALGQAATRPDNVRYNALGQEGAEKEWLREAGATDKAGYQLTPEEQAAGYNMWNETTPESQSRRSPKGMSPLAQLAILALAVYTGGAALGAWGGAAELGAGALGATELGGAAGAMEGMTMAEIAAANAANGMGAGLATEGVGGGLAALGAEYGGTAIPMTEATATGMGAAGEAAFNTAYPGMMGIAEAGQSTIPAWMKQGYDMYKTGSKVYNAGKLANALLNPADAPRQVAGSQVSGQSSGFRSPLAASSFGTSGGYGRAPGALSRF